MLTSSPIAVSDGMFAYYTEGGKPESGLHEYYMGPEGRSIGLAWGPSAERLEKEYGLDFSNGVDEKTFELILKGRTPDNQIAVPGKGHRSKKADNNGRVIQRQKQGVHIPGYDFTFSVPKSMSVEMIYIGEEGRRQFIEAQNNAIKKALELGQRKAKVFGLAAGKRTKRRRIDSTGEWMAFLFTHYTARPTAEQISEGRPPDLDLHTHVVIPNMGWADGKWRAFNSRRLNQLQREMRYTYEIALTDSLTKMGYEPVWKDEDARGNRTWDLAGSREEVRDFFSSRSREILKLMRQFATENGRPPDEKERQEIILSCRLKKEASHIQDPKWETYADVLVERGFGNEILVKNSIGNIEYKTMIRDETIDLRKEEALKKLTSLSRNDLGFKTPGVHKDDSTFYRWQIPVAILVAAAGSLNAEEVEQWQNELMETSTFVTVTPGKTDTDWDTVTTYSNLFKEQHAKKLSSQIAVAKCKAPPRNIIDSAIKEIERKDGISFDEAQRQAVYEFCSHRRWKNLTGPAGSAKTTVCRAVNLAFKNRDELSKKYAPKSVGVSVTGLTAQTIAEKIGCDYAYSVAEFELAINSLPAGSLVFLDEAVMTDTSHMDSFITKCDEKDLIVRCMGDFFQIEAIGPGGLFRDTVDAVGAYELETVYRQKGQNAELLKELMNDIRIGDSKKAVETLQENGWFSHNETFELAIGDLISHYKSLREEGLKSDEIIINTDAPNETIDVLNHLVQQSRLDRGELRGEPFEVTSRLNKRTECFYVGDLVAFTERYEDEERSIRVRNGVTGEVTRTASWGVQVRTSDRRTVNVYMDPVNKTQPLRCRYAGSAIRTQGREAKACLVLPYLGVTDRGSAYSMTTRAVERLHVFLGGAPVDALVKRWNVFSPKLTADSQFESVEPVELEEDAVIERSDVDRWHKDQLKPGYRKRFQQVSNSMGLSR